MREHVAKKSWMQIEKAAFSQKDATSTKRPTTQLTANSGSTEADNRRPKPTKGALYDYYVPIVNTYIKICCR